MKVYL